MGLIPVGFARRKPSILIREFAYYLAFAISCFYIVYAVYNPNLLYLKLQPFFSLDPGFVEYIFREQHGYISLASQFLMQLLYYPIVGSIILVFVFILFSIEYRYIFNDTIKTFGRGFELIPPFIVLVTLKNYSTSLDSLIMFILIGLFIIIIRNIKTQSFLLRIILQIACISLSYTILGVIPTFALVVFLVAEGLVSSIPPAQKLIVVLSNIVLLLLLIFIFMGFTLAVRSFQSTIPTQQYCTLSSYWFILATHVAVVLLSLIRNPKALTIFNNKVNGLVGKWIVLSAILLFTIIFYKKIFINPLKYNAQIEYYASEKKWDKILEFKSKITLEDRISRFILNRALYGTGQMAENLFSIPQEGSEYTLFLNKTFSNECIMHTSDLYNDMGFIKGANYWAMEAQTFEPYSPKILKRIALSAIILEDYPISVKYLNILRSSFIYHKWASELLDLINQKNIAELKRIYNPENIYNGNMQFIDNKNPDHVLAELLEQNNHNKMAFEYLQSYYLMRNELANFYGNLIYLPKMAYQKVPKIYQEAILTYYILNNIPEEKYEYVIDNSTKKRFSSFAALIIKNKTNPKLAKTELTKILGDTYWYYLRYCSPNKTGLVLKQQKI
jgi:hypothetical protein